jgi:hypothetical protein
LTSLTPNVGSVSGGCATPDTEDLGLVDDERKASALHRTSGADQERLNRFGAIDYEPPRSRVRSTGGVLMPSR